MSTTPRPWLQNLGIGETNPGAFCGKWFGDGPLADLTTPIDGSRTARIRKASAEDCDRVIARAQEAFSNWRSVPAPLRGETVRRLGLALREAKPDLGKLVTLETGKILGEGEGEIQEMIDICDFAVGLSRQLHG